MRNARARLEDTASLPRVSTLPLAPSEPAPSFVFLTGAPVTGGAKICVWYVCTCPGAGSGPGGEVTWAAA